MILKFQRLEVQRRTFEKQRLEIEKLEEFIRKNHYGQKAAQAEDRRKKLAQIERVPPPREIEAPPMSFAQVDRSGDIVLRASRLKKCFEQTLFADLDFQVERGQRWGILGDNGAGKTTLLRCLLGIDHQFEGEIQWGSGVDVSYFDQQLACVPEDLSPMEAVRPAGKEMLNQARRNLLARFGIVGDLALQPISRLSGGQRNRVALAQLAASDANVLILDEPTNHLDLWSREALARAIGDFQGTLLLVSHDRYFINQVCDHLIVFEPNRVRIIDGDYDTYRSLCETDHATDRSTRERRSQASTGTSSKNCETTRRRRRFPYRKVDELESEITQREAAVRQLQTRLSDPDVVRSKDRVLETRSRLTEETEALEQLYEHWWEACELN